MVKFLLKKLGRDKDLENFAAQNIKPIHRLLTESELELALKNKLLEEAAEIVAAHTRSEMIDEIADILIVLDGLYKSYNISEDEILINKKKKFKEKGGFEKGLYIEYLEMEECNERVKHFRKSPEKYPEIF